MFDIFVSNCPIVVNELNKKKYSVIEVIRDDNGTNPGYKLCLAIINRNCAVSETINSSDAISETINRSITGIGQYNTG